MMKRVTLLFLFVAVCGLAGCESIFGKEEGKRGALAGKREDVFAVDKNIKIDPEASSSGVDVGAVTDKTDWPMVGGSATRLNGALMLNAAPKEVWSTSIGAGSLKENALSAQPVIADGRIFTIDTEAQVSAFAVNDGKVLWQQNVPTNPPDGAVIAGVGLAYANGRLIATTSYGHVVAMDAATGKIVWQKNVPSLVRAAPFIAGEKVYVTATTNTLYEFNFADGAVGWIHAGLQENTSLFGMSSPLVAEDLVIVPFNSGEIHGVHKINGRLAWEENLANAREGGGALPSMADIQAQPVLDGSKLYVVSHSGRFVALDVRTGRTFWENDLASTQTPSVAGNSIFVVTTDSRLVALSREDGRVRWAINLPRYLDEDDKTETISWSGPVLAGGRLWLTSSEGELTAVNPQDGKDMGSMDVGTPLFLSPIVAGRTLYVLTNNGTLVAYR